MSATSAQPPYTGLSRLKLYFALSRTPHGILDMATPSLAALLWLGAFPAPMVIFLGLIAAFAGYTAVYTVNDLIDYKTDKAKIHQGGFENLEGYLDAILVRHPLAYDVLSIREGLLWVVGWSFLAIVAAYILNPVCAVIFVVGCALEVIYCLLLEVSHFRALISGAVKTSGGMAAVYAVDPSPSPLFLGILFLWIFFWEIGGQNIPADWTDIEEDRKELAKTIPVRLGPDRAGWIVLGSLTVTVILSVVILGAAPSGFALLHGIVAAVIGAHLLLYPAYRLFRGRKRSQAMALFNRASYYPLALLAVVAVRTLI